MICDMICWGTRSVGTAGCCAYNSLKGTSEDCFSSIFYKPDATKKGLKTVGDV